MATIKLKKPDAHAPAAPSPRAPVRGAGAGVKARPTLAQAQVLRDEREARYQEQLRQRFGERAPPAFTRRDAPDPRDPRDMRAARGRPAPFNTAFGQGTERAPPRPQPPQPPQAPYQPPYQQPPRPSAERAPRHPPSAPDWQEREPQAHLPGSMRLSKRMSELGIASRREADEWIAQGWVRVDDQVVKELGSRVVPGQRVTVDAKAKYQQAQRVTVLINKPVGYVSGQAEDGYEPAVVLVTPQNQWREDHSGTRFLREHLHSLVPAGRLDIDSVGLLVLTQDGRVAKQLVGEDSEIEKEYLVRVALPGGTKLPDSALALLRHGLELDGQALLPAQVEWVNADQLRFVLREGKKRQIRRMCEAVGLQVLGLKRVRIGTVMLGDLPTGQWRYLRMDEGFEKVSG
jgi:23S rRNA pseudouridine2604 synthase